MGRESKGTRFIEEGGNVCARERVRAEEGKGPRRGICKADNLLVDEAEHGDCVVISTLVAFFPKDLALETLHNLHIQDRFVFDCRVSVCK